MLFFYILLARARPPRQNQKEAEGVTLVDTSDMDLPETVEHITSLAKTSLDRAAERDRQDILRAEALRQGLADYELDEEDLAQVLCH